MAPAATKAKPEMLELVSRSANLWISLETNVDDYNQMGGMRKVRNGTRVRFSRGRASVPVEWREAIESTRGYGRDFWLAEDPKRVLADIGRRVVSGMATSHIPQPGDSAPIDGWDAMGAREIRKAIEAGEIPDLRIALAWETRPGGGKARVQVIDALGKAIRSESENDDLPVNDEAPENPEPSDTEDAEPGEGDGADDEDGGL